MFVGSRVPSWLTVTAKVHDCTSIPSSAQGVHTIVLVCAQPRPIEPRRPSGCRLDAGPSTSHCNARRCKVGHLANDGSKRPKSPPASRQSRTSCHHAPNLASNSAPKPILTETSPDSDWVEGLQAWVRANERPFCRCSGKCPYCSGRGRSLGKQEQTTPCVPEGLPSSTESSLRVAAWLRPGPVVQRTAGETFPSPDPRRAPRCSCPDTALRGNLG